MTLASVGCEWRAGLWGRGGVVLSKADIEAMDVRRGRRACGAGRRGTRALRHDELYHLGDPSADLQEGHDDHTL